VDSVKVDLDHLSHDVETQTKRVADKGSDISRKLLNFETTVNAAQKQVEAYQARADEQARRFETTSKTLESRLTQISRQADDVSIRQA